MFLRYKIWFTTITIYEIFAVSILHFQRVCDAIFMPGFCDTWYRYFLFCVAVPLVAYIIGIWIRQIYIAHHRHYFVRRVRESVKNIASTIREQASEHISATDIEKLIAAAVLVGVKRYADRHPNVRMTMDEALGYSASDTAPRKRPASATKSKSTRKK